METEYSYTTVINSHDCDAAGFVRTSCILKYLQEAANYQTEYSHPSTDELRAQGRYFVATKLSLTVHEPLYAWDEIRVSTWACPSRGATFNRCSKIERAGEVCATLVSAWALLDTAGEILRVSDVEFDFGIGQPLRPELPLKVRIPQEIPLFLLGEHTVRYPETDINRHMNNTVYADMLHGYLKDCTARRVTAFSINYLHEAPIDSAFKIYGNAFADIGYFRTVFADGRTGVEAQFTYVPIEND